MGFFSCNFCGSLGFFSTRSDPVSSSWWWLFRWTQEGGQISTGASWATWPLHPLLPSGVHSLWTALGQSKLKCDGKAVFPGLSVLLCKIKELDPEDLPGPFTWYSIGQCKVQTCSLLQRAVPSIPSMSLLVSTLPPSYFFKIWIKSSPILLGQETEWLAIFTLTALLCCLAPPTFPLQVFSH